MWTRATGETSRSSSPPGALPEDLGPEDHAGVTRESLRTQRFPRLTAYAGRRNADPDAQITAEQEKLGTPIMACLGRRDGVIVAYSNGAVRFLERAALGFDDDEPITVGPDSTSPLLRLLSEE